MEKTKRKSRFRKRYVFGALVLAYILMCQSCMTMRITPEEARKYFSEARIPFVDKTVTIEYHPIHYIETGAPDKPTLFFVHGSPGSWDAFKRYLADSLLLQKYRMIAVDRPGFGYSGFGEAEDLPTQSRWLTQLVKYTDNKKPIILVGHSLGGPVILKMATENPQLYRRLVVLSGAVDPKLEETETWRYFIKKKPVRYLIPGALRPSNDELWWLKLDLLNMQPKLKNITSDVTIIHGTKDPLVPYENVAFMKKEFVKARSITVIPIKGANHFIPWEHYETIRDALLELKL